MRTPVNFPYRITLKYGATTSPYSASRPRYGVSTRNLSYFDVLYPTLAPPAGISDSGITNIFSSFPYISPKQINKSTWSRCLPGRKTHTLKGPLPFRLRGLRKYTLDTFKSTLCPLYKKSKGVLWAREGRSAPYLSINQFSHAIPVWGLLKNILFFLGGVLRIYQARLTHSVLQYFLRFGGTGALQNTHNIFRYYQSKQGFTNASSS